MNDLDIGSIIADAQKKRASSIHIHPNKNEIVIRYKIDGIYHNIRSLSLNHKSELSAKLKILAMLDITERRIPQTGFFTFEKDNLKLKISISTLPTIFGERICLKFLDNHKNRPEKLFELGMTDTQIETLCLQLKKNSSLIVSAGPAGSGKSTMLKCLVSEIDSTQNNIMSFDTDTFTDDQNICQIKTSNNDGFSLSTGIRHAGFQEADIIIADIDNCETLDQLTRNALRGTSILCSLNVFDSVSAIMRIQDMGISPNVIASVLSCITSSKLVRKICKYCSEEYIMSETDYRVLELDKENSPVHNLKRGVGCSHCMQTGFMGWTGIYEVLLIDNTIRRMIMNNSAGKEIRKYAESLSFETLLMSGRTKVINGITTIEELLRIVH